MKPISIIYDLGSVNDFNNVTIINKNNKFFILFDLNGGALLTNISMVEIKDALILPFGFDKNYDEVIKHFKFFESYEECLEVIKERTKNNLISDYNKNEVLSSPYLQNAVTLNETHYYDFSISLKK